MSRVNVEIYLLMVELNALEDYIKSQILIWIYRKNQRKNQIIENAKIALNWRSLFNAIFVFSNRSDSVGR